MNRRSQFLPVLIDPMDDVSKLSRGRLVLIPSLLGNHPIAVSHPPDVISRIHQIRHFAVEKLPSAVHFLKKAGHPIPEYELKFYSLDKRTSALDLASIADLLVKGEDVGVISEAGCPGVADPGADLVWLCHLKGIAVETLVGPSSILLSIMVSGLNGQNFAFNGYLPVDSEARVKKIRLFESDSSGRHQTQLFIEAPHRNTELLGALINTLQHDTRLCVCWNLMNENQWMSSKPVGKWNLNDVPTEFNSRPAMFLFLAPWSDLQSGGAKQATTRSRTGQNTKAPFHKKKGGKKRSPRR